MIESKYTASIHKLLPKTIYKWKINDNFQGGVPDAYYSGHGGDLWIEYKYLQKLPKRTDTLIVPQLRSLQIRWLNDRSAEGRNCLVVVGCPDGSYIFNSDTWGEGVTTEVFKNVSKRAHKFFTGIGILSHSVGASTRIVSPNEDTRNPKHKAPVLSVPTVNSHLLR